jgi:LysR family pca operon transcriptional activator
MVGLSFEQLFTEPLIAVVRAGHPLAQGPGLPVTSLEEFPVVLPPFGTLIRQSAESLLSAWGVPPLSAFVEVLSVSTGRALALENGAVWFTPQSAVEYELTHGLLVRLPLPFAGTGEPVGLIRRSDTQPSAIGRAFIEAVRAVARERMATVSGKQPAQSRRKGRAKKAAEVGAQHGLSGPPQPR